MIRANRRCRPSRSLLLALVALCNRARTRAAEDCVTSLSRTAPSELGGAYIRTVTVRTDAPINLPFAGDWLASLRRTTETAVVQRQLLFAPGERADTARIGETLRRLRDQRIYSDVTHRRDPLHAVRHGRPRGDDARCVDAAADRSHRAAIDRVDRWRGSQSPRHRSIDRASPATRRRAATVERSRLPIRFCSAAI